MFGTGIITSLFLYTFNNVKSIPNLTKRHICCRHLQNELCASEDPCIHLDKRCNIRNGFPKGSPLSWLGIEHRPFPLFDFVVCVSFRNWYLNQWTCQQGSFSLLLANYSRITEFMDANIYSTLEQTSWNYLRYIPELTLGRQNRLK